MVKFESVVGKLIKLERFLMRSESFQEKFCVLHILMQFKGFRLVGKILMKLVILMSFGKIQLKLETYRLK